VKIFIMFDVKVISYYKYGLKIARNSLTRIRSKIQVIVFVTVK